MNRFVRQNFGSLSVVKKQTIVKVINVMTGEGALYNTVRGKRPVQFGREDVNKVVAESIGDPFCDPVRMTPTDVFGRVKGKSCITCANIAKFDAWHGVVVFRNHNPLDFSLSGLRDYVNTALKWTKKVYRQDKNAVFPFL